MPPSAATAPTLANSAISITRAPLPPAMALARQYDVRPPSEADGALKLRGTFAASTLAAVLVLGVAPTSLTLQNLYNGAARLTASPAAQSSWSAIARTLALEIQSYSELKDGWDGPGSLAPSAAVISNALKFLALLPPGSRPPETTVAADGEVGYFWKSPDLYIDVGFPRAGRISYYGRANGNVARGSGPFDGETIAQDLWGIIPRA